MDLAQVLQLIKELTGTLDRDVAQLESRLSNLMLESGIKLTKLETSIEANQSKLERLDRVVISGNGVESLQSTVKRIDQSLIELKQEVAEIKKTIQSIPVTNAVTKTSHSGDLKTPSLIGLLSDQKLWIALFGVIATALTAWGAYQESQSKQNEQPPAIESPAP